MVLGINGKIPFIHHGKMRFFMVEFPVGYILTIYWKRKEENNERV